MGLYALRMRLIFVRDDVPAMLFFVLSLGLLCVITPSFLSIAAMIPWLYYSLLMIPQLIHWGIWLFAAMRNKPLGVLALLSPCLPLLACASVVSTVALIPITAYAIRIILNHRK